MNLSGGMRRVWSFFVVASSSYPPSAKTAPISQSWKTEMVNVAQIYRSVRHVNSSADGYKATASLEATFVAGEGEADPTKRKPDGTCDRTLRPLCSVLRGQVGRSSFWGTGQMYCR